MQRFYSLLCQCPRPLVLREDPPVGQSVAHGADGQLRQLVLTGQLMRQRRHGGGGGGVVVVRLVVVVGEGGGVHRLLRLVLAAGVAEGQLAVLLRRLLVVLG